MSFAEKNGIAVASGFKLQAEAPIDARFSVDTIAERDELVTIHAAYEGLGVYVKATKTKYTWNGTGWDEAPKGNMADNLSGYVKKEDGKGLSSNDYTDEEKEKLEGLHNTTVDGTLSSSSVNPVQNKVVKAELDKKIPATEKGAAGGVAELDNTGKVPSSQLPSYVDDVIDTYIVPDAVELSSGWLSLTDGGEALSPEGGKIYIVVSDGIYNSREFRWSGTKYAEVGKSIALGEGADNAYPGNKGKIAYDHSQSNHAPANAQKNVQSDWNETDAASDAYVKNKPKSLPANGGDAATVGGHTVKTDVPENAKFTDTVYTHPSTHPASMITEDTGHRFVRDEEKETWNNKPNIYFASELPESAPAGSVCFLISE